MLPDFISTSTRRGLGIDSAGRSAGAGRVAGCLVAGEALSHCASEELSERLVNCRLCYAALQKLGELLGNCRAAEKVTLPLAATFLLQKMQLFLGFHALGHHAMLQALSYVNQRSESWHCQGSRK